MGHLGRIVWPNIFLGWAWAKKIRPKADLGQLPLGHLWAWAKLGPSWYIGPGQFGLGRARPKPIPSVFIYNSISCYLPILRCNALLVLLLGIKVQRDHFCVRIQSLNWIEKMKNIHFLSGISTLSSLHLSQIVINQILCPRVRFGSLEESGTNRFEVVYVLLVQNVHSSIWNFLPSSLCHCFKTFLQSLVWREFFQTSLEKKY